MRFEVPHRTCCTAWWQHPGLRGTYVGRGRLYQQSVDGCSWVQVGSQQQQVTGGCHPHATIVGTSCLNSMRNVHPSITDQSQDCVPGPCHRELPLTRVCQTIVANGLTNGKRLKIVAGPSSGQAAGASSIAAQSCTALWCRHPAEAKTRSAPAPRKEAWPPGPSARRCPSPPPPPPLHALVSHISWERLGRARPHEWRPAACHASAGAAHLSRSQKRLDRLKGPGRCSTGCCVHSAVFS